MHSLESHMTGMLMSGKINGVQSLKSRKVRTGMQGMAGSNTGSGKANKALQGNAAPPNSNRGKVPPVLMAKMPAMDKSSPGQPKNTSAFVRAFNAAKMSIQISTNSKAAAAGGKALKGSTATTFGAGLD